MMDVLFQAVADTGLGIGLPAALMWLAGHVKDQTMRKALNDAAGRAAGIAYSYLSSRLGDGYRDAARRYAISAAVEYMRSTMPDTLKSLGLSDEEKLSAFMAGELGKLLAVDPNVSIQPAAPS